MFASVTQGLCRQKYCKSQRIRELLGATSLKSYQHELNKNNSNRGANMSEGKTTGPESNTENYKQIRNTEIGRNSLCQGIALQLVIQYQMVSPEKIHTSNIIQTQTEEVLFVYLGGGVCIFDHSHTRMHAYVCNNNNGKRTHEFKKEQGRVHDMVWRKERKGGKGYNPTIISKDKR